MIIEADPAMEVTEVYVDGCAISEFRRLPDGSLMLENRNCH